MSDTDAIVGPRVSEIILTGPPRWGVKNSWIVQDGPPYYKQLAGPFTSRRDALEALAEIVNDAYHAADIGGQGDDWKKR